MMSEIESPECVEFTKTEWEPSGYFDGVYETVNNRPVDGYLKSQLTSLHELCKKIGPIKNGRFLDVGCGAVMANVMSASQIVDEIYMADYASKACDYVIRWMDKDETTFNWKHSFKLVAGLEGEGATPDLIEERLRSKVKAAPYCNILADDILPGDDVPKQYDVISVLHCLALAAPTIDMHAACLKKLTTLLKPRGYIIIGYCQGQSFWDTDAGRHSMLPVTDEDIWDAVEEAGLTVELVHDVSYPQNPLSGGQKIQNVLTRKLLI